jgi:hypothetical protein
VKKITVPLQERPEPAWKNKVDRWYQLDEMSYAFCVALHEWNYLNQTTAPPDVILLAIAGASNVADQDFISSGAQSPAKFVYTLPNISASVIFQMLGFSGKVFCFNKGSETLKFSLDEAATMAKYGKKVWVFASALSPSMQEREIQWFEF